MKKIISTLAAAALALTGAIALAPSAQAAAPTDLKNDKLFVKLVTAEAPEFRGISRAMMVKTAKSTCKFLRAGFGALDAVEMMEDNGFTSDGAVAFVAGAVVFYCPEQEGNY